MDPARVKIIQTLGPVPPSESEGASNDPEITIVTWDGSDDPLNPFNWSLRKKWFATGLGLLATFVSVLNGAIITVAHEAINEEFGVSDATFPNSYWPVTSWSLGGALFSLVILPVMEDFGVRNVFLPTYFLFVCFLIPVGFAHNFATLIVVRFITGGCVATIGNTVAGIVSNTFSDDRARTVPITLYITTYLAATSMGPVIGGGILEHMDWRWLGYLESIWTAALFPVFVIAMPESRGSAILKQKAGQLRKTGYKAYTTEELTHTPLPRLILNSMKRPLYMLCTESVVFVATLWSAFSFGAIYLFTQSVELVFADLYGWNAEQAAYVQAAIVTGETLGGAFCLSTNDFYYSSAKRNTEIPNTPIPEARLYPAIVGGFLGVTGGMMVYAWTSYEDIPWVAPAIGLSMVGFGTTCVVVSILNYIVDAYSKYAGSAIGAIGLGENMSIAFLPLAATSMYTTLGFQWASSLLGLFSLVLAGMPIALLIWGRKIRAHSTFMSEAMLERM